MKSRNNRRRRSKIDRREVARTSQKSLIHILQNPSHYDDKIVRSSSRHLVKISQRHRLSIPPEGRSLFCRSCLVPHRHGENVRVRILAGQRTVTCLECSNIRRYGGGPKFHRTQRS
ncbi:MAG: hypothetical protein QMC65_07690 [Candidatus Poseidoniaceae archaeon]